MGDAGLEHFQQYSDFRDSNSSAALAQLFDDPQLAALVEAWPSLPEWIRDELAERAADFSEAKRLTRK